MPVTHHLGRSATALGLAEASILMNGIQRVCDRIRTLAPELEGQQVRQIAALLLSDLDIDRQVVMAYQALLSQSDP